MPVKYARKTYRRKTYRKRPARKTKTVGPKRIRAIVKKEIHTMAENKKALPISSQVAISTPAAVGPNPYCLQYTIVGPNGIDSQIMQGTGEGGRVGNRITPRKLTVQGYLIALNDSGNVLHQTIPMIARLVIYRAKDNLYPINYMLGTSIINPWATVFQNGNTTLAPNNTYYDMMYLMNRDKYIVYAERRFKVGGSYPQTKVAYNNDFKLDNKYNINLSKKLKRLMYNDVDLSNTSHAMHAIIFFTPYDNSALEPTTNYLQTFYNIEMDYEDI